MNRYTRVRIIIFSLLLFFPMGITPVREICADDTPVPVELPPVSTFNTPNGIKVFYLRDQLPQLTIIVSAGFGMLYEEKNEAGISDFLARALSLGGSGKYPSEQLYRSIESIGGRLAISASWERTTIVLQVLERHAALAFDIVSDLLLEPNFDRQSVENVRSLLGEKIRRKKDHPAQIAFEKVRELIFGGAGYGSVMREETIRSITRSDLMDKWKRYFRAKNLSVGISTSLDFDRVKKYMTKLHALESGERLFYSVKSSPLRETVAKNSKSIFLIPKDIPQATMVVGTVAPSIGDRRMYPLEVMNYILGGGSFNSRLMREIRVKRGLSYAVQSILRFRKGTGIFLAYAQSNHDRTPKTLSLLQENIRLIASAAVTREELSFAKRSLNNSYIFEFNTSLDILSKYLSLEYNGLPVSFIRDYPLKIQSVTGDAVLKSSEKLLKHGVITVVVGRKELQEPLKKLGTVIVIAP